MTFDLAKDRSVEEEKQRQWNEAVKMARKKVAAMMTAAKHFFTNF